VNLDTFKWLMWPTSFTVCDLLLMLLDSYCQDCFQRYRWYRHLSFSVTPRSFYFIFTFSLSHISSQITRRKEEREKTKKEKENDTKYTPKLRWWHHQYRFKDLNEKNLTTPMKITNSERRGSHKPSKGVGAHLHLGRSCGPLRSLLVTFLGVVRFISSKCFQQYQ